MRLTFRPVPHVGRRVSGERARFTATWSQTLILLEREVDYL